MSSFPLLDLPLVSQLDVLRNMDIFEILKLSTCSKRAAGMISEAKIPIKHMEVQVENSELKIELKTENGKGFEVEVRPKRRGDSTTDGWMDPLGIQWIKDEFQEEHGQCFLGYIDEEDFWTICDELLETLLGIIGKPKNTMVIVTPGNIDLELFSRLPAIHDVQIWDSNQPLTADEVKCVLNKWNVKESVEIPVEVDESRFKYKKGFRAEYVTIENASWVTMDAVLNSTSAKIELQGVGKPTAVKLNAMLKKWMARAKMDKLKELSLQTETPFADGFLQKVLKGIEHTMVKDRAHLRRVDGKTAVVIVDEDNFQMFI